MQLSYYSSLRESLAGSINEDKRLSLYTLNQLLQLTQTYGQNELFNKINIVFKQYMSDF